MFRQHPDKVRHCYYHAMRCSERAGHANDPSLKQDHLAMQERWLRLARSYELSESVSDFTAKVRRHLGHK